jgi:CCR4-NOT complex subunit CAF16
LIKDESELRGATILYATHIFDGLSNWPTNIARLSQGKLSMHAIDEPFPDLETAILECKSSNLMKSPLLHMVEKWVRADKADDKAKRLAQKNGKVQTKWDSLSENMKEYGDKYYNYWN